jgi:hypothetical protein
MVRMEGKSTLKRLQSVGCETGDARKGCEKALLKMNRYAALKLDWETLVEFA